MCMTPVLRIFFLVFPSIISIPSVRLFLKDIDGFSRTCGWESGVICRCGENIVSLLPLASVFNVLAFMAIFIKTNQSV